MTSYRFKIDKKALEEFLLKDNPSKEALRAVHMVITAVIIKWYSKYKSMDAELHDLVIYALCKKRGKYDLAYSAYNYIFTIARNEIGNYLNKRREVVVEDILPLSNASVVPDIASLPSEINKFKKYLTGEEEFTVLDLTEREAVNLMCFCDLHQPSRKVTPPTYIQENPNALQTLYRFLLKL